MSMSIQKRSLLYDGIARVYVAEIDIDQGRSMLANNRLNLGQRSRLVIRYRDVCIVVQGERHGRVDLP